ncbi:hypothetical protein CerSpe_013780 [Prunus speciosa]
MASKNLHKASAMIQVSLAWVPPSPGQYKLNVDGTRKSASGCIGAGGVIRDSFGDWTCGFAANLGRGQILEAEMWGLFFGLKLAKDRGICNLLVEMDSAVAVKLVKNSTTLGLHPVASLASCCWELIGKFETCALQHIYRERNVVADCIAQWSYNMDLGVCLFDMAPSWVGASLVDDLIGVTRTRLVCSE